MQRKVIKGIQTYSSRHNLEWGRIVNLHFSRGLFFIPPLIGGHFLQQLKTYRKLSREHYDLMTYNYSGHGRSSDKFSLQASLRDTLHMLQHTQKTCLREGAPLTGIASCYAAIPLLYAAHQAREPMRRLILINAIPYFNMKAVFSALKLYSRFNLAHGLRLQALRGAIDNTLNVLFPRVIRDLNRFGSLERRRVNIFRILWESLSLNPLRGVQLKNTPVLCLYGRQDLVINMYLKNGDRGYRQSIRNLCPKVKFQVIDGDHFLSDRESRSGVLHAVLDFVKEECL